MSVYVDPLVNYHKQIGRLGPFWCHMLADTRAELDAMADAIGLARKYIQHAEPYSASKTHYDLTPSRRAAAVRLGAIEMEHDATWLALVRRLRGSAMPLAGPRVGVGDEGVE